MDEFNKDLHTEIVFDSIDDPTIEIQHLDQNLEPSFSDEEEDASLRISNKLEKMDEEEIPLTTIKLKSQKNIRYIKKDTLLFYTTLEPEELRTLIENLHFEMDNETRCQVMERIVQMVIQDEIDTEIIPTLASCLSITLSMQINADIFPADYPNDEALTDSISTPLFVMFRNQFQLCKEEDNRRKLLARVLAALQSIQTRIGYLLLYFLKIWGKEEEKREAEPSYILNDIKGAVYIDFCYQREEKLDLCLLSDLKCCHEDNVSMLCFLLPDIYMEFQNVALGNIQLLHLVVSTIDSSQIQDLVCQILQGHLRMLKKESLSSLLTASLNWETFEQYCFWQLIFAHDFPIDCVLPILPKLQFRSHAEALTSILLMLKQEKPTQELLKQLLTRQNTEGDMFVVAALKYWCREYEDKLGELLGTLLISRYPVTSPNKRKRSNVKHNQIAGLPTGEQVLSHLDQLRQYCISTAELHIYQLEGMQKALQQAQAASSDSLRKNYGDLFALAEVNEESESSPSLSTSSTKKHAQVLITTSSIKGGHRKTAISTREKSTFKRPVPRDRNTESSDQTSEDEEIVKPKQTKKRKKINPVGSDSD